LETGLKKKNNADASFFTNWSTTLKKGINDKLWRDNEGWFTNLVFPKDTPHSVWSYLMYDALTTVNTISDAQIQKLISHLNDDEFLSATGLFSISQKDTIHWDLEDVDWGGGGQYSGHPARVVEYLLRRKYPTEAFTILNRMSTWPDVTPYISQEQFGQFFATPHVEMPMSIAGAGYLQSIINGVFGFDPKYDGSLYIDPTYHPLLGLGATLQNYQFKDHKYDVIMNTDYFEVLKDGKSIAKNSYGKPVIVK